MLVEGEGSAAKMLLLFSCLAVSMVACAIEEKNRNESYSLYLQYVHLASDIQGSFGSSSVFIVNAGHYESKQLTFIFLKRFVYLLLIMTIHT